MKGFTSVSPDTPSCTPYTHMYTTLISTFSFKLLFYALYRVEVNNFNLLTKNTTQVCHSSAN